MRSPTSILRISLVLGVFCAVDVDTPCSGQLSPPAVMPVSPPQAVPTPLPTPMAKVETVRPGELPENVFAELPAEAVAAEAAKKAQHLQKIQQLTFDRRTATILKVWSTPPAELAAKEKEEADKLAEQNAQAMAASGQPAQPQQATPPDPFDDELKTFQRWVTLGDWAAVKTYLAKLPKEEGKALYQHMVQVLPNSAMNMMQQQGQMTPQQMQQMMQQQQAMQFPQFMEKNALSNGDVLAMAGASPYPLDNELITNLGQLLRAAIDQGNAVEDFLGRLKSGLDDPKVKPPLTRREAAKLFLAANCPGESGDFLPTPEKAEADDDREALNLLSRFYLSRYEKDKKTTHLEQAWKVTQAVLAVGKVDREQKDEALTRAVELAPKIQDTLGKTWLDESFTKRPERGMEIVATIGTASARGVQNHAQEPDFRKKSLDLQKTAVEALLKSSPERASKWSETLGLLASAWLSEADFSYQYDTSTSLGPQMQRDQFGNFFFQNNMFNQNQNMWQQNPNFPKPIAVGQVLDSRPSDAWLEALDPGLKPKLATTYSQLYLKVSEETLAFPYIERLCVTHPAKARELAEEFLKVWTNNHDPNSERNRTNPYMWMFGFERKAESIPLTRSKQERNLRELAVWVKKLRALPLPSGGLDESLIAKAFTTCHSVAEVYKIEAIETVFGAMDKLKPKTVAELVQQMRGNLVGLWRSPDVQEQNKTKRKEKDIRSEVFRGYEVAMSVADRGIKQFPGDWSIELAKAGLMHDELNYRQEIDPTLNFTKNRTQALSQFQRSAKLYADKVSSLSEDDETTQAYELWFYASLGACDLPGITEKTLADPKQPALIRQAIMSLPGPSAERHMSKFANSLFTRMSGLNPAVKFRYLKGGFEIVGDHKHAYEARKVYDYYKDLVTEIQLESLVDGSADIGRDKPFGVFVNIRHTREIERESGGFGRYLQNQNQAGNMFFYNYGRPLENYRDKFQEATTKALQEHFQVISVTFQDEKVNSRAGQEYGWRTTPYAYVLLKARSPEVDKIPPMRLDLDFLDTSGYVILPVESPVVPVVASSEHPPARPFEKLQLTQTLDERQAKDGKLILEVKAVALGLVPELDQVLNIASPGFHVAKTDEQTLAVSRFDPESDGNKIVSERSWLVTLQADEGLAELPTAFQFARPKVEGVDLTYQRYVDADLAQVKAEVPLEARYGEPSRTWLWWTIGGVIGASVLIALAWVARPRRIQAINRRFEVPDNVTPFTVLGLLREIQVNNGLSAPRQAELEASIRRLETHYFAEPTHEEPDLHAIASTWVNSSV